MIEWIGSVLLAACGIPLAWQAFKTKQDNTNAMFLAMWLVGELLLLYSYWGDSALRFNYIVNTICILVVIKYRGD